MLLCFITLFLYGLLLQFFFYNFVTFGLGRNQEWIKVVRLWKEICIGVFCIFVLRKPGIKAIRTYYKTVDRFKRGVILFVLTLGWAFCTHLYILGGSVSTFVLGVKYNFIGFLLVLLGYLLAHNFDTNTLALIRKRYIRVMKYLLLLAIMWYFVILIKPGTLKIFGYNNYIYEGQAGGQAPAAYYTHINQGIPRNQFLFERPTTWGFFLVAIRPFFFVRYLYNKPLSLTRGRWVIYAINILLTFSRAARGAWMIQTGLLGFFFYKNEGKLYLKNMLLPIIVVILLIGGLGFNQIIARGYSNRGHLTMIQKGVDIFLKHPWIGAGLASVGPGSHREGGMAFNPENQFLQVLIELGVFGFLGWMMMYVWMNWVGIYHRSQATIALKQKHFFSSFIQDVSRVSTQNMENSQYFTMHHMRLLLAFSVGMIGLSISGLVLHSFVDRMVVYPYCFLFGIVIHYVSVIQKNILQANQKVLP